MGPWKPRRVAPDAWKTWLRDGSRLVLRDADLWLAMTVGMAGIYGVLMPSLDLLVMSQILHNI